MSSLFDRCSLYLHPIEHPTLTTSSLISELEKIGLIAKPFTTEQLNDNHFSVGESYLDHIAYMGCSPNIQFEASDDNEKFCSIKIHNYEKKQLIVSKTQSRLPQCPECKKPVKNWQATINDKSLICENCGNTADIEDYNWRKMGGFARLFIEVTDIFPKEAIPQQSLLDKLATITNTDWQYFYSCQ